VRVALAWALFWLGDRTDAWLVGHGDNRWNDFWAEAYQRFMRLSIKVQGNGRGPWK
jgi:hypothetical protein